MRQCIEEKRLTENEIVRAIYLDLGRRFSFDLEFCFGNSKTRKKIYNRAILKKEDIEEYLKKNKAICRSLAYTVEYILKELGINIITVTMAEDDSTCPHVHNIVIPKEGESYIIDLQQDLKEIQSHSFPKSFGLSTIPRKASSYDKI